MMRRIAFLYPGQGSQKVGMGSDLPQGAPQLFTRYFAYCDEVTQLPITQYCLEGPAEILSQTHIAQPALFIHSLALTEYAYQQGLIPNFVAGHSLGEYTATVVAGVLTFEEGLHLVCQRGRLMYQAQQGNPGAMAAVQGMRVENLQVLCQYISKEDPVVIANWNSPDQLVVSGSEKGIARIIAEVRSQKEAKIIKLPVHGSFHSPSMTQVQQTLAVEAKRLHWRDARLPISVNVEGTLLHDGQQIQQALIRQITNPVRWITCIQTLEDAGCNTFVELGSKQVLTKLVQSIAPQAKTYAADTLEKVAAIARSLQS